MLDLFMDPAVLAAAGALGGGVSLKVMEKALSKKPKAEVEKPVFDTTRDVWEQMVKTDEHACPQWTARWLEQRMVDGQVMSVADMTTCDMEGCLLCAPTHTALKEKQRIETKERLWHQRSERAAKDPDYARFLELQKHDKRYRGYRFEDWLFQENLRKANNRKPKPKRWNGSYDSMPVTKPTDALCCECNGMVAGSHHHLKFDDLECDDCSMTGIHTHEKPESRIVKHKGISLTRPKDVPARALPSMKVSHDGQRTSIIWEWPDGRGKGQKSAYHQPIETEEITFQDNQGKQVRRTVNIYDPDTGEHLGDYQEHRWDSAYLKNHELEIKKALSVPPAIVSQTKGGVTQANDLRAQNKILGAEIEHNKNEILRSAGHRAVARKFGVTTEQAAKILEQFRSTTYPGKSI